jgi:hypothetical protein
MMLCCTEREKRMVVLRIESVDQSQNRHEMIHVRHSSAL